MKIFLVVIAFVLAFICVLAFNAVKSKAKAKKLGEEKKHFTEQQQTKYAEKLGEMIRCKTVSVRGSYDDTEFAKLRQTVEKLFPTVHQKAERMIFGDDCWIYKIEGKDKTRNIMLMSHHDVVAAKGEWKHPEFCGEIHDGAIWGRGTVDTKTSLFAEFAALEELLIEGFVPECNLYIGSSHNEEIFGDGIPLAVEYFKKQGIEFETVLDEGGGIIDPPLDVVKCKCAMIAVHEKGRHNLICTAKQNSATKAFTINNKTPIMRMVGFIAELNSKKVFKTKLYPVVKSMFDELSPYTPFGFRLVISNLWCFGGLIKTIAPKINPQAATMTGTTRAFTEISGSLKECSTTVSFRFIDENDFKEELKKFKKIAEKHGIEIRDGKGNESYIPADMSHKGYEYTRQCVAEIFPHVASAPYLLPAGTDARHLTEICKCALRFAPIEMNTQQFDSVHNENENISVKAVANAVAFYKYYIKNYK